MKLDGKTIVVTGGAGFIGSHLVKQLLKDGHDVVVIDNMSGGNISNLSEICSSPNLDIVKEDIQNFDRLCKCISGSLDAIFHIAALVVTTASLKEPQNYARVNIKGTYNIAEIARLFGVKKIIFASSAACYGSPDKLPINEDARINPIHPYALSKYIGEQYLMNFCRIYNIDFVALRLFYVYGPNTRENSVLNRFLNLKAKGLPLTIKGDGSQSNDYVYIEDVIEAFIMAMESSVSGKIYNVGTGIPSSIHKLASYISKDIQYVMRDDKEPDNMYADISKIKKELGWEPKIMLEEGMQKIIEGVL